MIIKFTAACTYGQSVLDEEQRSRSINLAVLNPIRATMNQDDKDENVFHIFIYTKNTLFNQGYRFDSHLGGINFFNDIGRYILSQARIVEVSSGGLFSSRSKKESIFAEARKEAALNPLMWGDYGI